MAGCGFVRGCGGCDFFIFSFILERKRAVCVLALLFFAL